ncbi:MAG: redox-sensing transcriptional repressor Rex [Clostridia bacterium]|nr:redox-sensing transcriptional repressor Rex [Clostridia bacterium]
MKQPRTVTRATLGRLPEYLSYLQRILPEKKTVSATAISRELGYGEVQVRKDLSVVSGAGKPKVGYVTADLVESLERYLTGGECSHAVIVGAGKLGGAILDYDGFLGFGLKIIAAFDTDPERYGASALGKPILPMEGLEDFCRREKVRIGIITVPAKAAQEIADRLIGAGVSAIWSFAPTHLRVPETVFLQEENLALSLAHLRIRNDRSGI